jgi:ribosomal protein S27E
MNYIYKREPNTVYVKCSICEKKTTMLPPEKSRLIEIEDCGDYYQYPSRIFNCNHKDDYPNRVYKHNPDFSDDLIHCPNCGSTQIQLVNRGWNVATGLIGSGKMERYCINCKSKF